MKNKIKFSLIWIIVLICITNSYVIADDLNLPQPSREFYVYDEANILDETVENYIVETNESLHSKTGAQIVVATVNSLQNRSIEEYANRLFRYWEIGSKEKNNGILFLIAPTENKMRIEIGYGLEGAIPDGKAGEIRDKMIIPYFKKGNYNKGTLEGFKALVKEVKIEYNIDSNSNEHKRFIFEPNNEHSPQKSKEGIANLFDSVKKIIIIIGIIIFLIIDFTFFDGFLTFTFIRIASRGGFNFNGGGNDNHGGGGSSGGGGASGGW
ncbi:TPM domain-containing protein [Thermohalobacter berrensis]|uniref:TPM domain-containing protein n=1 Tax=Thermohalobacter berrensis TaxID=99594 RepID=A0A419T5K0_9FIRM|nr:TPM domain-containing protein [Thermohalobacter berrensis]RKD32732.1 hypothetical protein BET03_10380 [Thermohalobacter berrensis]